RRGCGDDVSRRRAFGAPELDHMSAREPCLYLVSDREAADKLHGVTMQELGVSKLMPANLPSAARASARENRRSPSVVHESAGAMLPGSLVATCARGRLATFVACLTQLTEF